MEARLQTLRVQEGVQVAIACCRAAVGADRDDLYPDPDSDLLARALQELGVTASLVSWDDPLEAWEAVDLVVIRSTWDSVDRPEEYLGWARKVDQVSSLVNTAAVVEWNLDKSYLRHLERQGVGVVPTLFVRPGCGWDPPAEEFVVKPAVSAGGRETARYRPSEGPAARAHVNRLHDQARTAMIQPYLPGVADPGEISLVFIDGTYSHAVRKGAVLEVGAGVHERPWEKMVYLGITEPSAAELHVGRRVHTILEGWFAPLAYSRVDLLTGPSGQPLVLEVELIDPVLSLSESPGAVERLASGLAARAQRAKQERTG